VGSSGEPRAGPASASDSDSIRRCLGECGMGGCGAEIEKGDPFCLLQPLVKLKQPSWNSPIGAGGGEVGTDCSSAGARTGGSGGGGGIFNGQGAPLKHCIMISLQSDDSFSCTISAIDTATLVDVGRGSLLISWTSSSKLKGMCFGK